MISRSHIKYLFVTLWLLSATFVHAQSFGFGVTAISDSLFCRMQGKSYPAGCTVSRNELRLVNVLHIDFEGNTRRGEIICNKSISSDLLDIFRYGFGILLFRFCGLRRRSSLCGLSGSGTSLRLITVLIAFYAPVRG